MHELVRCGLPMSDSEGLRTIARDLTIQACAPEQRGKDCFHIGGEVVPPGRQKRRMVVSTDQFLTAVENGKCWPPPAAGGRHRFSKSATLNGTGRQIHVSGIGIASDTATRSPWQQPRAEAAPEGLKRSALRLKPHHERLRSVKRVRGTARARSIVAWHQAVKAPRPVFWPIHLSVPTETEAL
jgi:hypothetical protein